MSGKRRLEHPALVGLFLVLAILAVYLPVIGLDFTNYDDPDYVTDNRPVLAGLTWESVAWAFTHSHSANWHPLTWLSHMLDCQLYGLNPAGHHLTNLVLHTANSVLLFLLLRYLTGAVWRSAAVAALFALHPMHVESVAWVSERKDVLSAFFGLLCLWAYAAYARRRGAASQEPASSLEPPTPGARVAPGRPMLHARRYYLLALGLYVLGLTSKPMLVTWPFVMLLLDYWPLRRFDLSPANSDTPQAGGLRSNLGRLVVEKLPFLALSAASCLVTVRVQRAAEALAPLETAPLTARLLNALVSYARYLAKLVWPSDLAVLYPYVGHWPT